MGLPRWLSDFAGTSRTAIGLGPKATRATLSAADLTAPRAIALPDKAGTVALTSDITGAGNVPDGGTTGQVLAKHSNTDQDTEWKSLGNAATKNVGTTAGQVIAYEDHRIWKTVGDGISYGQSDKSFGLSFSGDIARFQNPLRVVVTRETTTTAGGVVSEIDASGDLVVRSIGAGAAPRAYWRGTGLSPVLFWKYDAISESYDYFLVFCTLDSDLLLEDESIACKVLYCVPSSMSELSGTWTSLNDLSEYTSVLPTAASVDSHTHASSQITDSTAAGRSLLTAANAAAQRTSLGVGTSDSPSFAGLDIADGGYVYIRGDATTDGSVRLSSQATGTLQIEKRVGGNWSPSAAFATGQELKWLGTIAAGDGAYGADPTIVLYDDGLDFHRRIGGNDKDYGFAIDGTTGAFELYTNSETFTWAPDGTFTAVAVDVDKIIGTAGSAGTTGTGTVAISAGSTTVTGTGTAFTTELSVGDIIEGSGFTQTWTVIAIASDTSLTISKCPTSAISSGTAFTIYKAGVRCVTGRGLFAVGHNGATVSINQDNDRDCLLLSVSAATWNAGTVFQVKAPLSTSTGNGRGFSIGSPAEGYDRLMAYTDGKLGWGSGSALRDIFAFRSTTKTLGIGTNPHDTSDLTGGLSVYGTLSQVGGTYHYLRGDEATTGSVRWSSDASGTLKMETRTASGWITGGTMGSQGQWSFSYNGTATNAVAALASNSSFAGSLFHGNANNGVAAGAKLLTLQVSGTTKFQIDKDGLVAIAGTQVVGAQGSAVADAAGGSTVDSEARTAINTLLSRLRTHGLIAT